MAYYENGLHLCRVTQCGMTETQKEPKRPMIVIRFQPLAKITHDPEGNELYDDLAPSQYDQTARIVVDPNNSKSLDFATMKLRYAGFTGQSFKDLDLEGKEIRCNNEPSEYEGKLRDQWDLALPPLEQRPLQQIDSAAARKLDAMFGKRLKDGATQPESQETTQPQWADVPEGATVPDDEVPF